MADALTIQQAIPDDIPALNQLVNSAYRGDGSRAGWTTEADLLDGIRTTETALQAIFSNAQVSILKAVDASGNIVGCVQLELQPDALYLGMLTVAPHLQNSGIGKKLLYAGEEWARKNHRNVVRMSVITVRESLIAWYQRHGYQPTGTTIPFPDDPKFGLPKQPLAFMVLEKQVRQPEHSSLK